MSPLTPDSVSGRVGLEILKARAGPAQRPPREGYAASKLASTRVQEAQKILRTPRNYILVLGLHQPRLRKRPEMADRRHNAGPLALV